MPARLSHPNYRADIDGLRAVAVLAVIGFHAFPSLVRGGFVGVDIFFVISGFLISTIIFESLGRNSFSFAEFYSRRIKRIFPALLIVLFASWAFSEFALLPDEYSQLGKHIVGGAGFVSNYFFWRESGYFDEAAITKPLLHLWSLGVEEQFYLVWPLLVWLAWKKRRSLFFVILFIAAASFALNIDGVRHGDPGPFFFPQTRFWELMIGALLACGALDAKNRFATPKIRGSLQNLLSLLGAGFVAAGFLIIDKGQPFPGWSALLPTAGAALIILAGPRAWFNRVILSNGVLVWVGLISFPLYLWHWPILSFAQILLGGTPSVAARISAVAASLVLAWLTYQLIERPIRFGRLGSLKTAAVLLMLMALMAGIGYRAYLHGPLLMGVRDRDNIQSEFARFPPAPRLMMAWSTYGQECNFFDFARFVAGNPAPQPLEEIAKSCYERDPLKPKSVFLWGHSFVQMLRYGLQRNMPADWQILQVATSGCRPDFKASTVPACARSNAFAIERIKALKPDVVVVGSNRDNDPDESKMINDAFKSFGVGKVAFIGPTPPWTAHLPKIVARQRALLTSERTFVGIDRSLMEKYAALNRAYAERKLTYVDVTGVFCNADGCLTRIGDDIKDGMVSYDDAHLMPIASDYLARNGLVAAIIGGSK